MAGRETLEQTGDEFTRFWQAISDAAVLLRDFHENSLAPPQPSKTDSLPSLLEQCEQLCEEARSEQREPIRTIHHFACTGGTLLSKCIASMPNTQLLSEVDPLRGSPRSGTRRFAPTDLVYRIGDTRLLGSDELVIETFLRGLSAIYDYCCSVGSRLVVRDHSHSHFCTTADYASRKALRTILFEEYEVLSVLSVRHPLDSYLSLRSNDWIHFSPGTLEEYCLRYIAFLGEYRDCSRFRYEDVVANPEGEMFRMCDELKLPYSPSFMDVFGVINLTGDSGRASGTIAPRKRRDVCSRVVEEAETSKAYKRLCAELDYEALDELRPLGGSD